MTSLADTNGISKAADLTLVWPLPRGPEFQAAAAGNHCGCQQETVDARANHEGSALDNTAELNRFLAGVEQRAFRIARFGVRNADDALDIVQDAMIQLVRKYGGRPAAEWTPLFYRILGNRVRDFQRHATVRSRVLGFLPGAWAPRAGDVVPDVTQNAPDRVGPGPAQQTALDDSMEALEAAVEALPGRQREAFLLRSLEGLAVRDTASAMGCSEGSVKTHYFRALGALREALGEHWQVERSDR